MVNRESRETKAETTHVVAMKIVETERTQGRVKTDRLRALRLAQEAKDEALAATAAEDK